MLAEGDDEVAVELRGAVHQGHRRRPQHGDKLLIIISEIQKAPDIYFI